MKKFDSHKWIKDFKMDSLLAEADVFSGDSSSTDTADAGTTSNRAVKKFELLVKEKAPWDKVRQLVPEMSDIKQVEFAMALLADLQVGDTALKKLKLKL